MFKKAVFVILCLMAHHMCMNIVQPRTGGKKNQKSHTGLILGGNESEMSKCNISIPDDALEMCNLIVHPLNKSHYFNYNEALCITLTDFMERIYGLCDEKKLPKWQLESDPDVKNISVLCGKMRSVLNDTFSDTKDPERKEWIIALKNKLNDEKRCIDACIHSDGISPVCLTLLQINSYLISNISEKLTSATSGDSETTSINKKQDVSNIQKAASNLHREDNEVISEMISKNTSLHVQQGKDQQNEVILVDDDTQELSTTENVYKYFSVKTEPTVSTIPIKDKVKKKDDIKIPEKEIPVNKPVNRKHHINDVAIKEVNISSKPSSNTQDTNNDQRPLTKKPSSDKSTLETNVDSKINELSPSIPDETTKDQTLDKLPLEMPTKENDKASDRPTSENNKDQEKKKTSSIAGETNEKTSKPASKLEDDNKKTNLNKPSAHAEENDKKPLPKPAVDIPKNKSSDDKTANSPEGLQDSKTQSSDKSKTTTDSSAKKMSVPEADDVMEQTQAQPPDTESEITEKDETMFDENTSNEEPGEKNVGENEDTIDLEDTNTLVSDGDDGNNMEKNKNSLPEIDESMKGNPEKRPYTPTFVNAEDSHFFAYFMTMVIICIIGYLVYHNKQKILALALEGRSRKSARRRPNTSGYRKLDSNLEEAVTSACSTSVTHVIY